jgi:hypothetical protein
MKKLLAVLMVTFTPSIFAAPVLPKIFWGNWASVEKPDQCDIPKGSPIDFPESGLKIGADGISQYEAGCSVVKIINSTEKSITAKFECGDTEGNEKVKMTLTLSADGKYLSGFGGASKFIRCK